MRKIYKKLSILVFLIGLVSTAYGNNTVTIYSLPTNTNEGEYTVKITLWKSYSYKEINTNEYKATSKLGRGFCITLEDIKSVAKIAIKIEGARNFYLADYCVMPRDSIRIHFGSSEAKESIGFSGKGAQGFKCKWSVDSSSRFIYLKAKGDSSIRVLPSEKGRWALEKRLKRSSFFLKTRLEELDNFRHLLSKEVYDLMYTDIVGSSYAGRYLEIQEFLMDISIPIEQKRDIQGILPQPLQHTIPEQLLGMSKNYIGYLYRKSQLELALSGDDRNSILSFYNKVKGDYSGLMRELVLLHFLMFNQKGEISNDYEYCLADMLTFVKNDANRLIIYNQLQAVSKKSDVYPFELKDVNGKIVRPSDFKGKVILLDFWFNGCAGCIKIASIIDKVLYPLYKNKDVAFVSVNINSKREAWLNGLSSGKYTSKQSTNVNVGELGIKHPFLTHYTIWACPRLILVGKDGKIYSSTPPMDEAGLIKMLNLALE